MERLYRFLNALGMDIEIVVKPTCEKPVTKPRHCYAVIVYWSERDGAFIAEAPELPGSAADGPTYQEAITNLEVVMDEWIEIATEKGRTIPEPKARRLGLA